MKPSKRTPINQEERWHRNHELLAEFKKQNGHCRVTRVLDKRLGSWVEQQRQYRKRGTISEDRVQKLNDIGFDWRTESKEKFWNNHYQLLVEFKKNNGDCQVIQNEKSLGSWVSRQRTYYRKGILSEDHKKKLNAIGFEWKKLSWQDNYLLLTEFKKKHGHCKVKRNMKILGNWVRGQRAYYNEGHLTEDRTKKLNDIGVEWQVTKKSWYHQYSLLVEFKKINGHCGVNEERCKNNLGRWVTTQRMEHKKGCLSEAQVKKLNDIGFVWTLFAKGKASNSDRQPSEDNHQPHQQQTTAAMAATGTLKQPFTPITTTPIPENVTTSQPCTEMDNDNGDSNICEEFKETATYSYGDSENWV